MILLSLLKGIMNRFIIPFSLFKKMTKKSIVIHVETKKLFYGEPRITSSVINVMIADNYIHGEMS